MEFELSEEQTLLKDSVSKYLADNYDFKSRQELVETSLGYSNEHWNNFAEFGWLSVPFDEAVGGFGGRIEDTALICEQFGRSLVLEPFLANVILAGGILALGGKNDLLTQIISGEAQCAFAGLERQSRQDLFDIKTTATDKGEKFVINGEKTLVQNGSVARYIVLTTRTAGESRESGGITLLCLDTEEVELERTNVSLMDGAKVANLRFDNLEVSKATLVGEVHGGAEILSKILLEARIAVGAEMVGIMDVLRDKTVEYSRTRKQFGVAIGSFQALQHRMVEMFMAAETSRSMLYRAICEYQQDEDTAPATIAAMKSLVGQKARLIGEEAIQLHGGMGMTDELDIGHYVKRLMVLNHLFGDVDASYRDFCKASYAGA